MCTCSVNQSTWTSPNEFLCLSLSISCVCIGLSVMIYSVNARVDTVQADLESVHQTLKQLRAGLDQAATLQDVTLMVRASSDGRASPARERARIDPAHVIEGIMEEGAGRIAKILEKYLDTHPRGYTLT